MTYRLTRIITRSGDGGTTSLADGSRVGKDSPRIEALGTVDELNSVLGVLLTETLPEEIRDWLLRVQNDLFDVGAGLAVPGHDTIQPARVTALETQADAMNAGLPPLQEFILPGGSRAGALAHLARSVCRRAERTVVCVAQQEIVSEVIRQYLNRLSDALFILARYLNQSNGQKDICWQPYRPEKG